MLQLEAVTPPLPAFLAEEIDIFLSEKEYLHVKFRRTAYRLPGPEERLIGYSLLNRICTPVVRLFELKISNI